MDSFDFLDLNNYQHPPCMFILWYAVLMINGIMEFINPNSESNEDQNFVIVDQQNNEINEEREE